MSRRSVSRLTLLVAVVLVLAACGDEAQPPGGPGSPNLPTLEETSWIVVSVNGVAPVVGTRPFVSFGGGGKVKGSGGCNGIGGSYQFEPSSGHLALTDLGGTAMGCLDARVTEFETAFLRALASAGQASLDGSGRLLLGTQSGVIILAPERAVP